MLLYLYLELFYLYLTTNFFFSFSSLFLRCLWFVLEILMAKNENNSHAFIRKMVENIKQTKDAQGPDDAKMNEVCNSL